MFKLSKSKPNQTCRVSPESIILANETIEALEFDAAWERARADTAESIVKCLLNIARP